MGHLLSKLAFLTFLGFAVIMLTGPVLGLLGVVVGLGVAVLSVILPFAFVGFLIWLPFYLFDQWRRSQNPVGRQWQAQHPGKRMAQFQQMGQHPGMGQQQQQMWSPLARRCGGAVRQTADAARAAGEQCCAFGHALGGIFLETVCGAATLGILAAFVATELPHRQMENYVVVGILLGSLFGFLIGLANHTPSRRAACNDGPRET